MAKTIDTRRHRAALPVFTPSAVSPESLALRTVGREAEIERLVRAIRTAATTDNRPHQLIVGPRGSGKSHLLIVALHEALADRRIAERVAVAMLPEDAVEIAGYDDLLVSIVDRTPGGTEGSREAARDLRVRRDTAGLEQLVLALLGHRVLVLVVENLDRVFHDLGEVGQARLRNLSETSAKVLLLASTPLLSDDMSEHARPWYGSFDVGHLGELDAEQGRDLLRRIASASGDRELTASLASAKGLARVRAVEHLAGGSPRMWTVLAGCMTVDLLDDLVPLVEALFDELAPYYQQRLWDLAGVERKLVYELCRDGRSTVRELARATGVSQRAAATSLGRLHDARWVRREKRPGTDLRTTWYSLREPLLRHHVAYRETRDDRLPAIVGFLRNWYEAEELARHLASVSPASLAEAYVLAALVGDEDPLRRGAWPLMASTAELVAAGRCWIATPQVGGLASVAVGVVVEAVGMAVRGEPDAARSAAKRRVMAHPDCSHGLLAAVEAGVAAASHLDDGDFATDWRACARGLLAASRQEGLEDRDRIALVMLASQSSPGGNPEPLGRHAAIARGLPAEDDRMRLIFMAHLALEEHRHDEQQALADARDLLLECAERLPPGDATTRMLVAKSSASLAGTHGHDDPLKRFAAAVVDVVEHEGWGDDLSRILTNLHVLYGSNRKRPSWYAVWADATSGRASLGAVHRLMRALDGEGRFDIEDLDSEDYAYLSPFLEFGAPFWSFMHAAYGPDGVVFG